MSLEREQLLPTLSLLPARFDTAERDNLVVLNSRTNDASRSTLEREFGSPRLARERRFIEDAPEPETPLPAKGFPVAILLDVATKRHQFKSGETIESIAKENLGADATAAQVEAHIKEIRFVHGLAANEQPKPGDTIIVPGHNTDGDTIFKDSFGTTTTWDLNGTRTVQYRDGTGYSRYSIPNFNQYIEQHFGPNPADNFEVTFKGDGTFERSDSAAPVAGDLRSERAHLEKLILQHFTIPAERARFRSQMTQFESRATKQNLSEAEVASTYNQISRVLEAGLESPISERKRVRTALGIIDVAAQPTRSDQGNRNTCNVTTVENRLFTLQPSSAAKLIADVATTGKYVATDGTTVFIDKDSLQAHGEEATNGAPGQNKRNYASQLFQVTAANLVYVKFNEMTAKPGEVRYEQHQAESSDDTGERLIDYKTGEAVTKATTPRLTDNLILQIHNQITGTSDREFYLSNSLSNKYGSDLTNQFSSKAELEQKLKELQAKGQLPAILGVFTHKPPFGSDQIVPDKNMFNEGHVVLVVDYDPVTGMASIDNQWGSGKDFLKTNKADRRLTLDQLYQTTLRTSAKEWLDRTDSQKDTLDQWEYLRQIGTTMGSFEAFWANQEAYPQWWPPLNLQDRNEARTRYKPLLSTLTPTQLDYIKAIADKAKEEAF